MRMNQPQETIRKAINDRFQSAFKNSPNMRECLEWGKDEASEILDEDGFIESPDIVRIMQELNTRISQKVGPVKTRMFSTKDENGQVSSMESGYVYFRPIEAESPLREQIYELVSVRVYMGNEEFESVVRCLPVAFNPHSVSRFIELTDHVDTAMSNLALEAANLAYFISLMNDTTLDATEDMLFLPAFSNQGMFSGTVDRTYVVKQPFKDVANDESDFRIHLSADPLAPYMYTINNYIGKDTFTEDQEDYFHEFREYIKEFKEEYDTGMNLYFWPDARLLPSDRSVFTFAEIDELNDWMASSEISGFMASASHYRTAPRARSLNAHITDDDADPESAVSVETEDSYSL